MVRDTVHPDDLPSFDAMIARGMTGTDVDFVFRIVTSQGIVKHVRGLARVMAQLGGRPLFIGALQDITESKVAEEALSRARAELAHMARVTALSALTTSIAHEINQPLAAVVTNANAALRWLAAQPPDLNEARDCLHRIVRDGNRASEVITRIRSLVKKSDPARTRLDLNAMLREVLAIIEPEARQQRVRVHSELAADLPPVVGDRVQLQQVILNLVMNGVEAMKEVANRPRELLIESCPDGSGAALVVVRDSGVGLGAESAGRVFEAFYTTKPEGMGMGLSISRSIIESHGGRLWAEANGDHGATFRFTLPADEGVNNYDRSTGGRLRDR
jgi:C4-dicarboxylate-specific signal transduction histidine kinase